MPRVRRVSCPDVEEPPEGTFSNCLVVDGVVYTAGITARGGGLAHAEGGGEFEQTRVISGKIRALIEATGGSMADIVKLTVFVTDIGRREDVWRARREFFAGDFPASSLVQVSALAHPALKVEIEAIAHIGATHAVL